MGRIYFKKIYRKQNHNLLKKIKNLKIIKNIRELGYYKKKIKSLFKINFQFIKKNWVY